MDSEGWALDSAELAEDLNELEEYVDLDGRELWKSMRP